MKVVNIRIRETAAEVDAMDKDLSIDVHVTHVGGESYRKLWARRIELGDRVASGDGLVIETSDGVTYLGEMEDIEESARGIGALITLS